MINFYYDTADSVDEMFDKLIDAIYKKDAIDTKKTKYSVPEQTKLSPPWNTLESKIKTLFADDDEIEIKDMYTIKNGTKIIEISSEYNDKLFAVAKVLKSEYRFGNVAVKIKYTMPNKSSSSITLLDNDYDIYFDAFASTPSVVDIKKVKNFVGDEFVVVVFKKEVVQFFNDDLSDYYGNWNGLYTDIARDLLRTKDNVIFTIAED